MRRHYIVHGRVQGVGFRYFVRQTADGLGLTGWVRNRPDGTVEAEVQGPPELFVAFETALRQGPSLSRVSELAKDARGEVDGEDEFAIRY